MLPGAGFDTNTAAGTFEASFDLAHDVEAHVAGTIATPARGASGLVDADAPGGDGVGDGEQGADRSQMPSPSWST